jgi:micrococcal nuclease
MQKPRLIAGLVTVTVMLSAGIAWAALPPGGTFTDDDGNTFEGAIEAIAAERITLGCNPPANTMFCPDDQVTRGQMAIFIVRAYDLPPTTLDFFTDDSGKVYEDAANRLAQAGLTQGCAPNLYCGDDTMTRGEMAAFLSRAENLPTSNTDHFVDDNSSIFEPGINKVADARITLGCNPPANTNFCPGDNVTRGQMAGFLTRALDLTPIIPPPRPTTTTTTTTTTPPSPACDSAYPDFCIPPPPPDLDCGDVGGSNFTVRSPDPHGFDADGDGVGCEA